MKSYSVLIPTYKNKDFLMDCVNSILSQKNNIDLEIFIGIDNCKQTLDHIYENKEFYNNCKIFFFEENLGSYKVKNFLATQSNKSHLITFDSDDILLDGSLRRIDETQNCPIYFLGYQNFKEGSLPNKPKRDLKIISESIFSIEREIFLKHGGYMPWRIGADSEFKLRMSSKEYKIQESMNIDFFRRIHKNNTISNTEYGFGSKNRSRIFKLISGRINSGNFPDPEINIDYLPTLINLNK